MSLEITSVAKRPQPISRAAAAVFVISRDDIRRSGVTSIPEALRMAPGVQVARIDGNKWAITARGFNGRFANKLLVLMDGRSVYTPTFAGVYWDVQDTILEDIERIEVIRGPGASLWGSNAVNGVINIITRTAAKSQGGLLSAGAGNQERGFAGVRYGGEIADIGHYRVYGKFLDRAGNHLQALDINNHDSTQMYRAGFRADLAPGESDDVTVQGDYYNGRSGESDYELSLTAPYQNFSNDSQKVTGTNILTRWKHQVSATDSWALQGYYDYTQRYWDQIDEVRNTYDLDFQYRSQRFSGHDLVVGFGYRYSADTTRGSFQANFNPRNRGLQLFSAFLQDDIALIDDKLTLTLGSRLEHNDYTGFEGQPNARLLWSLTPKQSLWASVARAVRIPSRGDVDVTAVRKLIKPGEGLNSSALPLIVQVLGGRRNFDAESLIAYELGYRQQVSSELSADVSFYYHDYSRLRATSTPSAQCYPTGAALPGCLLDATAISVPASLNNAGKGQIFGMELDIDWRPLPEWRLRGAYSLAKSNLDFPRSPLNAADHTSWDNFGPPNQMLSLRSLWNPHPDVDFDLWFRYMDRLIIPFDSPSVRVPGYAQLDARLAWRPVAKLELSIVGQNLLDNRQPEFYSEFGDIPIVDIKRSIFGQVRWEY